MKKSISFKLFFTVLWRAICQVFRFVGGVFGYKDESTYAKVVWRIFAGCITSLVALFTVCILYSFTTDVILRRWIRPQTEMYSWDEKHISNHIVFQTSWSCDKGRVYDKKQKKVVLDDVDWVVTSEDKAPLAVYARKGKRGYLNRFTGEVALPEIYTRAWVFSEGLAAVEKDGELLFVNHNGDVVIDRDFEVCFHEPKYAFKAGYCTMKDNVTGKIGLIDKSGEWALNPEYDMIFNDEGFWLANINGNVGLFTAELDTLFHVNNVQITVYDEVIEVEHANHITKRYDFDGNVVVDFVIDEISNMQYETDELRNGMAECDGMERDNNVYGIANRQMYKVSSGCYEEYFGLISRDGKRITPPLYTSISAISKNRYLCQPHGVVVDDNGKIVE